MQTTLHAPITLHTRARLATSTAKLAFGRFFITNESLIVSNGSTFSFLSNFRASKSAAWPTLARNFASSSGHNPRPGRLLSSIKPSACSSQTISRSRSFSAWPALRAARSNWYAGRPVQAERSGPIKKLQRVIDRRVPKSWLFFGIIGANVAVFLSWEYARNTAKRFRDFGPLEFMYKNFAAAWANLARPWTLITSCFSHMDSGHILVNLLSFYFMGSATLAAMSASQFLGLYLLAGLAGNAVQMIWSAVRSNNSGVGGYIIGASGAVSGVLSFYAMAFPQNKIFLMMVVPVPAWLAVTGIIGYDMYRALFQPNGVVASAAHLGGAGAGILYYLRLTRRVPF